MLTNLTVAPASQDRLLLTLPGLETLTESVHRDTDGPSTSALVVTFSGVQISGMITHLYYEIFDGNVWSIDSVYFTAVPSGLDTVTIAGVTYTFVNALSGLNNIPLQATAYLNAVALWRVVNASGVVGTDFWPGQTANPYVSGIVPENPLTFRAVASGISGNILTISTTSDVIIPGSSLFSGGRSFQLPSPDFFGVLSSGIASGGNGTYIIQDVPFSTIGRSYLVHLWFANASGLQALDTLGNLASYWKYTPFIIGRTYLPYYAEVSGLSGYNLFGAQLPSNGVIGLIWTDTLTMYDRAGMPVNFAAPAGSGLQTQLTGLYDYATQGQLFDYVIFVFTSSGLSPQEPWPRSVDANGTWYFAGITSRTDAILHIPPESTSSFSIWVGFGNKDTRKTSGLPFRSVSSSIYIS